MVLENRQDSCPKNDSSQTDASMRLSQCAQDFRRPSVSHCGTDDGARIPAEKSHPKLLLDQDGNLALRDNRQKPNGLLYEFGKYKDGHPTVIKLTNQAGDWDQWKQEGTHLWRAYHKNKPDYQVLRGDIRVDENGRLHYDGERGTAPLPGIRSTLKPGPIDKSQKDYHAVDGPIPRDAVRRAEQVLRDKLKENKPVGGEPTVFDVADRHFAAKYQVVDGKKSVVLSERDGTDKSQAKTSGMPSGKANELLNSVERDEQGRTTRPTADARINRDSDMRPTSIVYPDGHEAKFAYDDNGAKKGALNAVYGADSSLVKLPTGKWCALDGKTNEQTPLKDVSYSPVTGAIRTVSEDNRTAKTMHANGKSSSITIDDKEHLTLVNANGTSKCTFDSGKLVSIEGDKTTLVKVNEGQWCLTDNGTKKQEVIKDVGVTPGGDVVLKRERMSTILFADGKTTNVEFDDSERVSGITYPDGSKTQCQYESGKDGKLKAVIGSSTSLMMQDGKWVSVNNATKEATAVDGVQISPNGVQSVKMGENVQIRYLDGTSLSMIEGESGAAAKSKPQADAPAPAPAPTGDKRAMDEPAPSPAAPAGKPPADAPNPAPPGAKPAADLPSAPLAEKPAADASSPVAEAAMKSELPLDMEQIYKIAEAAESRAELFDKDGVTAQLAGKSQDEQLAIANEMLAINERHRKANDEIPKIELTTTDAFGQEVLLNLKAKPKLSWYEIGDYGAGAQLYSQAQVKDKADVSAPTASSKLSQQEVHAIAEAAERSSYELDRKSFSHQLSKLSQEDQLAVADEMLALNEAHRKRDADAPKLELTTTDASGRRVLVDITAKQKMSWYQIGAYSDGIHLYNKAYVYDKPERLLPFNDVPAPPPPVVMPVIPVANPPVKSAD